MVHATAGYAAALFDRTKAREVLGGDHRCERCPDPVSDALLDSLEKCVKPMARLAEVERRVAEALARHVRVDVRGMPRCNECHHMWVPGRGCDTRYLLGGEA